MPKGDESLGTVVFTGKLFLSQHNGTKISFWFLSGFRLFKLFSEYLSIQFINCEQFSKGCYISLTTSFCWNPKPDDNYAPEILNFFNKRKWKMTPPTSSRRVEVHLSFMYKVDTCLQGTVIICNVLLQERSNMSLCLK